MDYEKAYKAVLQTATQWIKDGCTDKEKICLECVFPELRESEDERMMREFNDWLCEEIECRTNDLRDEKDRRTLNMLCYILTKVKDWLEKQKEQNPCGGVIVESEYDKGWRDGHKAGLKDAEMQKPVEIHNPTDEEIESWRKELTEFKKFAIKQAKENQLHISYTRDVMWENFCSELLSFVNSRKPVEWSEDDKNMWTHLNGYLNGFSCSEDAIKQMADWFYELPNRFNLQPKQEWSEEDKTIIEGACNALEIHGHTKLAERLKSLRPQPHWKPSEELMGCLERVMAFKHPEPEDIKGCEELLEQLKKPM